MKICPKCEKLHEKEGKYCSRKCANSRSWSNKDKKKKSIAAFKSEKTKLANAKRVVRIKKKCLNCSTLTNKKVYCCRKCRNEYELKNLTSKQKYYKLAQFGFDLKDYPSEFDFELIKKHGWYKAKNRGNNPNGINRDHLYTISEGFKNNINPLTLAHPANCKLITHEENLKKRGKSTIVFKELLEKIEKWNEKYKANGLQNL